MIELRPEVRAFAEAMEMKLRQNDHKGGWAREGRQELLTKLYVEWIELREADKRLVSDPHRFSNRQAVLQECLDVANFAMMIADNLGLLET